MSKEKIIGFITDLPKSPKDMAERLKRVPLWYKAASVVTITALVACQLRERFGFVTPPPEGTQPPPTEIGPSNNFPIATATTEVNSYGQYEFIEQSEIEANLKKPYEHFKNNPDVKALFNDSGTIEYSAMGIRVYLQGGGHTNYIFFEALSETEEKGYIAMVFGGGQPGEISYSVLNRIVDSNGMVGLGLTSDIGGNRLENPVMIFNTGLTEKEISQLTADDLLKRDILFIPGGIKVPSERIIGPKALFAPISLNPTKTPTPEATPTQENYRFSSSIEPENLQVVLENSSMQPISLVRDQTEAAGRPLVAVIGNTISYELTSDNGERSMYVLFSTKGGVIKAKIDYVRINQGNWPQPHLRVNELTQAQAAKVSDYLNNVINCNYTTGLDRCSFVDTFSYISIVAINNEGEAGLCRKDLAKLDNSEQLCYYDSSLSKITPQEIVTEINNAIVSTKNKSPEEILNFDRPNPLLSVEGNAYIVLQVPVIQSP